MAEGRVAKWTTVQLPVEVWDRIRAFLDTARNPGYASVAEFVRDAIRRRLDEFDVQRRAGEVGRRLDDLRPDADRAASKIRAAAPNAKPRHCHKCGEPLPAGAVFCSGCGTKTV